MHACMDEYAGACVLVCLSLCGAGATVRLTRVGGQLGGQGVPPPDAPCGGGHGRGRRWSRAGGFDDGLKEHTHTHTHFTVGALATLSFKPLRSI